VRIDLGGGAWSARRSPTKQLTKLKKGEKAYAVIKATDDVMVGLH
jgi:molybdopterin-binding protein